MIQYFLNKYITNKRNIGVKGYLSLVTKSCLDKDSIKAQQLSLLNELLTVAAKNSPFYKDYPSAIKDLNDLGSLPIITKKNISESFERIFVRNKDDYDFIINSSGGSTGEPTRIAQDLDYRVSESQNLHLVNYWKGISPYDSMVKLWGAERDTYAGKKSFKYKFRDYIRNRLILNCFSMNDSDMKNYCEKINRFKPAYIYAYSNSLYELASYINNNKITMHSPKAIHTGAGPLADFMREEIEMAFSTTALNHYGCREVGCIASECSIKNGFHVLSHHNYVEIVDENGNPVNPGETGRVIVTNLHNKVFPLIRYEIGDMATLAEDEACACGVSYPKLQKINGRITESINIDGRIIQAEFFIHTIGVVLNNGTIQKFQVIHYSKERRIMVLLVTTSVIDDESLSEMKAKLQSAIMTDYDVDFSFVDSIPVNSTGKHVYVVNK